MSSYSLPKFKRINSATVSQLAKGFRLMSLSANLKGKILTFLNWRDLISVTGTCKALRKYTDAEYLWKQHLRRRKGASKYSNPLYQCIMEHQLLRNYFTPKYTIYDMSGHTKAVTTIDICKEKVLTGAKDNTVKLWNLSMVLYRMPKEK